MFQWIAGQQDHGLCVIQIRTVSVKSELVGEMRNDYATTSLL